MMSVGMVILFIGFTVALASFCALKKTLARKSDKKRILIRRGSKFTWIIFLRPNLRTWRCPKSWKIVHSATNSWEFYRNQVLRAARVSQQKQESLFGIASAQPYTGSRTAWQWIISLSLFVYLISNVEGSSLIQLYCQKAAFTIKICSLFWLVSTS